MKRTDEAGFETVIEQHLLRHGYVMVDRDGFDRERAIFPSVFLDFIVAEIDKTRRLLEARADKRRPGRTP